MQNKPEEILESALNYHKNGEYELSLKNYQWFFNNAVKIDKTFVGAKYRSLKEWCNLANDYKPAYNALVQQKHKSLNTFKKKNDITSLSEYAKICHVLNMDKEFIDVFSDLCYKNTSLAKSAYRSLENILITNKEWALCNLCIDNSLEVYKQKLEIFDELIKISNTGFHGEYNLVYEKKFEKDIQNLLWILKVGNRDNEINNIVSHLKNDLLKRNIVYNVT